jgi:hypothetical protein
MDDVSSDINAEVSSDGAWLGLEWLGLSEHLSSGGDNVGSLPNHGNDWSAGHVLHEFWEEWKVGKILVVLLKELLSWRDEFKSGQFVSSLLESSHNLGVDSSLDSVRFDHDVALFLFTHL